jgi:hypothetical protein
MTSTDASQSTRWPRLRSAARHPGFNVQAWRSGPLSAFRMRFDGADADAIQQVHVGRVSIGRGGDGLFEGFTDGVRYKTLRTDYPMVVVAWWPSEATSLRAEADVFRGRLKRLRAERADLRQQMAARDERVLDLEAEVRTLRDREEAAERRVIAGEGSHQDTALVAIKLGEDLLEVRDAASELLENMCPGGSPRAFCEAVERLRAIVKVEGGEQHGG